MFANRKNMQKVGSGLARLTDFFGCELSRIAEVNLRIALLLDCPEWLRGKPGWDQLPRRFSGAVRNAIYLEKHMPSREAEIIAWIVENTTGRWDVHARQVFLDNDEDAVHFKLRWC